MPDAMQRQRFELKFTDRFPNWYRDLVETFDLTQCGAAKYCMGVTALGPDRLGHRLNLFADHGLDPATLLQENPHLNTTSSPAAS
jgi:hypothetical protein